MRTNESPKCGGTTSGTEKMTASRLAPGPSHGAPAGPRRPGSFGPVRGKPLIWHLSLFGAALVIPALALIVLLFWHSAEAERARIEQEVRDVAEAVTLALDRDFLVKQSLLVAVATANSLRTEDYAAFHLRARELAQTENLDLVLRDLGGQTLVDTRIAQGQPLPRANLDVDAQVVQSRRPAVSNLFIDATSHEPSYAVVAPVLRDGEVVALLSAVTPSERAAAIIRDKLPAELWAGSLSDRNGIIVARTRNHARWVGTPITDQLRRAAVQPIGTWDGPSHEGNPLRGSYARSPASGWLAAVGVERNRLMAPFHRMLWLTGSAAATLAALSTLLALVFGRRINRAILGLADAAFALGRTGTVPRLQSGVAEVDGVGTALVEAAADLRQRDQALRDSEQRLQVALDAASLANWDLDLSSDTAIRSLRHDQMFGYTELQSAWGQSVAERHVVEEDRPLFRAGLASALKTGVLSFEVRVRWPDGSIHWIAPVGRTSYDDAGRPVRMAGVVADITERKRAEAALRMSEERFRKIFEHAASGIVIADRDGRIHDCNAAFSAMIGYGRDELLAMSVTDLVHPEDREANVRDCRQLLDGSLPSFDVENRYVSRSGEPVWVHEFVSLLRDERGAPAHILKLVSDVTERRRAEEALRRSEAIARARADEIQVIYDAAPIGIVLFDRDFRFLRINQRLAGINGRSHADHVGRPIEEVLPAETVAALRAIQPRLLAGEEINDIEISGPDRVTGEDGTFLISYRPLRGAQGTVSQFLGTVLDITARRQAEAALHARTREAVAAGRLLDALMRYVPAGITIAAAPDVSIVRVSDYGSRLLQRPRERLEGITAEAHVDAYKVLRAESGAPGRPEELPLTRSVRNGEIVMNEEWIVVSEAGRRIPVLCNAGPIRDEEGNVVAGVIIWNDITELKAAREHQRLLLGELNHRVKNMLATVQGIANQSFQQTATAEARQAFEARIVGLARTHDLLTRRNWQDAGLRDVVLQALAPFDGPPAPRFDIDGDGDVRLQPKAALAFSMALHELATNAVKYGALSNSSGRVGVAWEVARHSSERLLFSWRETGGPPVRRPERRGFGSMMIERGLARELNADVSVDYAPEGLAFRLEMPLHHPGALAE